MTARFTRSQLCNIGIGLAIALALAPRPARASDPHQPATSYIRTTFSVEDGLSSNVVNAIVQTRNGFLWIGTDAGLNRFDGRHFTPIYFRGPSSTPQGVVSSLAEGLDGDLWVGTSAGLVRIPQSALDRFDRSLSVFYHPGPGQSDEITWLHCARDGVLWVGTGGGLYRFVGNQFESVIRNASINRIEESLDGHLLVVSDQGFIELDGTRVLPHPGLSNQLGIDPDKFYHVFEDRKGVVWFCTSSGLARRVNGSIERLQPYGVGRGHGVFRVYEDPQGNLWAEASTSAQSTGGIFRISGNKLESFAPNLQVRAISADREGNLWLGTNGEGLLRFKDRPIRIFTKVDGLPNVIPMTVLSKSDGSVWVGNNCGGVSVLNGKGFKTYNEKDGLSNSCVWALAEGKNAELWVGTWGGGLYRFANGHFVQFDSRRGLAANVVRSIATAHDGSLWIATEHGLSHMVNEQFHNYRTTDGLSSNRVVSVYQDRHGTIWVGTSRGVNRMTGDRFAPVLSSQEIFDPRYVSFAEDSLGDLYVLSAPKGISRIEGDHLVEVNHDLDLLSMVASPSGELWFTGGNGIFRFSSGVFTQNKVGPDNPLDYAWFGKADGMPSTQCSIGAPNVALAPDGKLWVATVQGLAMLTLSHLSFDTAKPRVFVEDVTVGRTRRPAGPELVLPPGTHHVELRFDSISLASPEKIRFQYRMDNVDPVWLDADNSLAAVYTNIPVGTQAFRIRASNSTGVWDREGMVYQVTQQPYIYQTMWFRALCVAVFLALLWGLHRYGMRQVAHEFDVRLEERLNERTRIAQELHDTLLQSFQGLLLHLYVISNLLPRLADEAKDRLNGIIEQAQQAVNEGRDAVQGLRLSTALNGDLAAALGTLVEGLGVKTNQSYPEFHLEVEGKERELKPLVGDEVYRIVGEALRNAFRHAEARRVEVVICYDEKQLTVHIRDDGKGMTEQVLAEKARPGHWGLQGMRERAGKIGAQLKLWSRQETGTEVELKIPAATAYQSRSTWNWLSFRHSSDDVR